MSDCGVCIGGVDFDGYPEFHDVTKPKARKQHRCEECGRTIAVGQVYERCSGKFDGDFYSTKTCLPCAEIAEAFYCEGRITGNLWDDMEDVMDQLTTSCFDKLTTPEAKAYLRERWMQWKGLKV